MVDKSIIGKIVAQWSDGNADSAGIDGPIPVNTGVTGTGGDPAVP